MDCNFLPICLLYLLHIVLSLTLFFCFSLCFLSVCIGISKLVCVVLWIVHHPSLSLSYCPKGRVQLPVNSGSGGKLKLYSSFPFSTSCLPISCVCHLISLISRLHFLSLCLKTSFILPLLAPLPTMPSHYSLASFSLLPFTNKPVGCVCVQQCVTLSQCGVFSLIVFWLASIPVLPSYG